MSYLDAKLPIGRLVMKKFFICVFAMLLLGYCGSGWAVRKQTFRIIRVYDGDTVMAAMGHVTIYVMLMGIDAPEISDTLGIPDQPYGREAKEYLSTSILHKEVEIEGYGKAPYPDNYIRGVIYQNGKNINLEMAKKGLAEAFDADLPPEFEIGPFLRAEKEAMKKGLGMWSLGDRYVSPSRWRALHKLGVAERP